MHQEQDWVLHLPFHFLCTDQKLQRSLTNRLLNTGPSNGFNQLTDEHLRVPLCPSCSLEMWILCVGIIQVLVVWNLDTCISVFRRKVKYSEYSLSFTTKFKVFIKK